MRGSLSLALLLSSVLSVVAAEDPVLQRITLADGRVLEGVLDEKAATIQLYNLKTGKPLAVLPIKLADITTRETVALNKPADGDAPGAGDDAKPKAKRGADGRFLTNHPAALKLAKELNRPVFAFFTGSDWCPVCQRMQKEVLMTPVFREWAERSVVLLELDYPNKLLAKPLKEQNDTLKRQFGISGYPTVHLLAPADGKSLGNVSGLFDGGPEVYIDQLIKRFPAAKLSK
jgi:thiol-disulfide isomerase/thioredoxin